MLSVFQADSISSTDVNDEVKHEIKSKYSYWYISYVSVNRSTGDSFKSFKVVKLIGIDFKLKETYIQLTPKYAEGSTFIIITFFSRVPMNVYNEYIGLH